MEPLPGKMPMAQPITVPRRTGAIMRFQSSLVGMRLVIFAITTERSDSLSKLRMISPNPNMPIATVTKPMPSANSGMPNVYRCVPEVTSVPIKPNNSPITTIPMAWSKEPWASTTDATKPKTIREK